MMFQATNFEAAGWKKFGERFSSSLVVVWIIKLFLCRNYKSDGKRKQNFEVFLNDILEVCDTIL